MNQVGASTVGVQRRTLLRFSSGQVPSRRLFCLPYAGGSAGLYRSWVQDLPGDVEVVAVQLPGRNPGSGEPPLDSIASIVAAILPEVEASTDLPYALFGHSMGAMVAFELAVALEQTAARPPTALFVSSRRGPEERHTGRHLHALPDADLLDEMDRIYGGVPVALRDEPDLLALFLPILRADVRAFETYEPLTDRVVHCPVVVYGGADDAHPRPDELGGWQRSADRDIAVRVFPGTHFYLTTARAALLADLLSRWAWAANLAPR